MLSVQEALSITLFLLFCMDKLKYFILFYTVILIALFKINYRIIAYISRKEI